MNQGLTLRCDTQGQDSTLGQGDDVAQFVKSVGECTASSNFIGRYIENLYLAVALRTNKCRLSDEKDARPSQSTNTRWSLDIAYPHPRPPTSRRWSRMQGGRHAATRPATGCALAAIDGAVSRLTRQSQVRMTPKLSPHTSVRPSGAKRRDQRAFAPVSHVPARRPSENCHTRTRLSVPDVASQRLSAEMQTERTWVWSTERRCRIVDCSTSNSETVASLDALASSRPSGDQVNALTSSV